MIADYVRRRRQMSHVITLGGRAAGEDRRFARRRPATRAACQSERGQHDQREVTMPPQARAGCAPSWSPCPTGSSERRYRPVGQQGPYLFGSFGRSVRGVREPARIRPISAGTPGEWSRVRRARESRGQVTGERHERSVDPTGRRRETDRAPGRSAWLRAGVPLRATDERRSFVPGTGVPRARPDQGGGPTTTSTPSRWGCRQDRSPSRLQQGRRNVRGSLGAGWRRRRSANVELRAER